MAHLVPPRRLRACSSTSTRRCPAGRAARTPLSSEMLDAGLAWNTVAVDELASWPEQRYLDYLAEIDTDLEVDGVGNAQRVLQPGRAAAPARRVRPHRGVPRGGAAAGVRRRPGDAGPRRGRARDRGGGDLRVATAQAVLVAADAELTITTAAAAGAVGDVDLYVRRGAPPTLDDYDCRSQGGGLAEQCTVDGDGPVYAALLGLAAGEVEVTAAYREADVVTPTCLAGQFPADAVVIKADWRRVIFDDQIPIYDTSGPRMAVRLRPDGSFDWGPGDGSANPGPSEIYTVQLSSGAVYRLAGLHIMTKELTHWMWITLWWSPEPDTDFGADRPAAIAALPGPWAHYKLAVSVAYLEEDPDPRGGQAGSLGDALAAVHGGVGQPTWASNPYIELGAGNAATNCIGCHQHGGTDLTAEQIIGDEAAFPHHGTTRVRNNFFTDYSWAVQGGRGDDLGAVLQAEVDYWDASE
ncbi:MAG: hypothetical protein R2939_08955 [Kofleriaceae bacterium]